MTRGLNTLKIKMDGQEHELTNVEVDSELRTVLLDLDDTVTIEVEDVQYLFDKELEILHVGCDDEYVKARIDSFFVDEETNRNQILGLSF